MYVESITPAHCPSGTMLWTGAIADSVIRTACLLRETAESRPWHSWNTARTYIYALKINDCDNNRSEWNLFWRINSQTMPVRRRWESRRRDSRFDQHLALLEKYISIVIETFSAIIYGSAVFQKVKFSCSMYTRQFANMPCIYHR